MKKIASSGDTLNESGKIGDFSTHSPLRVDVLYERSLIEFCNNELTINFYVTLIHIFGDIQLFCTHNSEIMTISHVHAGLQTAQTVPYLIQAH